MIFGQQHATSAPWFQESYGQAHTIPVEDFPHTQALAGDYDAYLEYLRVSWDYYGLGNTEQTRRARLERLLSTPLGPVKVVTRPDGRKMVVDGNHRAAAAYAQGVQPELVEVTQEKWLQATVANPKERYGTKPGKPYQSVFHEGREWVEGRRRDTLTRHETIGETGVLDLGCNIGAATFLAGGHGVDASPRMVTSAWRLAAFFSSPTTFQVADLNAESFEAETVFCFAVAAHLQTLDALRQTLSGAKVVYFEENAGPVQFPKVVDLFSHVEELPGERRLYRCVP
jgi:hypothetical protein